MEGAGHPSNDSISSHSPAPQAEEINGKLQQTPDAQWKEQQESSMRETEGRVT